MLRTKVVWIPIYRHYLILCDADDLNQAQWVTDSKVELVDSDTEAFACDVIFHRYRAILIAANSNTIKMGELVHECGHATNKIFLALGADVSCNHEPHCYLLEFIFVESANFFKVTQVGSNEPRKE